MGDRYTITERVDQGGMAEVFRGVAESIQGFKKAVAIKRILPNLTKNKKFVAMFLDEARLSLHLQHANIVHVFDIGRGADTTYFIVMEYIDGCNLKTIIEHHKKLGRPIRVAHALYMMIEVCKGLAYAHDMQDPETGRPLGIVHRDISPPNILLSRNGEVKLVDFGLAKATSQLETTDPGVVKGKFSYLSPEAASGLEVDHRADLFAVGILLWEMLTGKRLFYGESDYQTVELVRQARVPSIAALNPEVKPELEAIVRKALARDPNDRYQHAADLQDALAQYLFSNGLKVTSRDIAQLVRDATAEKKKSPPKTSLIDALIMEEMAKFTSLDELGPNPISNGASPLSPEEVGGAGAPLDPNVFVDTRGWASDLALESDPPAAVGRRSAGGPGVGGASGMTGGGRGGAAATPGPAPTRGSSALDAEFDSLQQLLEPDKTGVQRKTDAGSRTTAILIALAVLLAGAIGGGLFFFKDRLFGP